ncbi:hypothetical protein [Helicobacter sp. T3_23-1056]
MIFSHQNQVDEAFLSSVLECVKSSQDKISLKNALFSLIRAMSANNASNKIHNADFATKQNVADLARIFGLFGEIFCAFREKIYGILERGDILDCSFLYLSFITPNFLVEIFGRNVVDFGIKSADFDENIFDNRAFGDNILVIFTRHFYDDERFFGFVKLADKMLVSNATNATNTANTSNASQHISQEEWLMLVELGSISRVLAFPSEQYRAKSHKNAIKTSKIQKGATHTALSPKNKQKTQKNAPQNNVSKHNAKHLCELKNGLVFFSAFVSLSDMQCAPAQKIQPFIYEAYRLFRLDFSLLEEAIFVAFKNANTALKRRNVCNWQLHIFWNVAQWFNIKEWLNLYPLWKKIFYERIAKSMEIMDFIESNAKNVLQSELPHKARQSTAQSETQAYLQEPNLQPLYQAIDEVLYLQLFIYHFCGNSFVHQGQWRVFNTEVLEKSSALYREFGAKFLEKSGEMDLPKSSLNPSLNSTKTTKSSPKTPPKSSKKIIGFLRDRFVENSPFKVEYSLIKNLMDSAEFREKYSIKIYCMSLIEKSENDPRIMQLFARLGVEIIDIGLGFNKANFYNSHLQKALALRELMLSDKVAVLISPNNGYGISDFLLSVRCAPTQVFWTHGNFVYDIEGIDERLTHICNDLREIAHEGVTFGGIPVKMDNGFYNPPILEGEITQARQNIAHLLAQNMKKESNAKSSTHLSAKSSQKFEPKTALDFGRGECDERKISKTDKAGNEEKERDKDFGAEILQDKVILGVMGRLTKIDSVPYLEVVCEILHRRKECVFLACGVGNEEHIRHKILQINPSVLSRFCFTGQIDSAVYGHIIDVWLDSFPMEQGESRIEYVAKGRGIALRYFDGSEGEYVGRLAGELEGVKNIVSEILGECDLSFCGGDLSLGTQCDFSDFVIESEQSERGNLQCNIDKVDCHANADAFARNDKKNPPSLAEGVRGWVKSSDDNVAQNQHNKNSKKMDFAGYKNMVLGFSQNRAFCKDEYLQKALKLIDSTKKKDKNFKNALRTQSLIFEIGNAIKERLGVRYFMEFLDSHT